MSFSNSNGTEIVISTPLRTAIGTFSGALKDVPAADLGTPVAQAVIPPSGNDAERVISTPLRTAIGTFSGALKDVPAVDLGTTVAKEVISRSGIDPEEINQVIVGNVLMAGQGMNPGDRKA